MLFKLVLNITIKCPKSCGVARHLSLVGPNISMEGLPINIFIKKNLFYTVYYYTCMYFKLHKIILIKM